MKQEHLFRLKKKPKPPSSALFPNGNTDRRNTKQDAALFPARDGQKHSSRGVPRGRRGVPAAGRLCSLGRAVGNISGLIVPRFGVSPSARINANSFFALPRQKGNEVPGFVFELIRWISCSDVLVQRAPGLVLKPSVLWWHSQPPVEGGRATKTLGALASR